MPTKSYVLNVPRVWDQTTTRTDSPKLQQQLQALLKSIDSAGESVIAIQAIQSGWGSAFMNEQQFVASSVMSRK